MKNFVKHTYDDIGRIYHFDDGSQYYSVTTMLGATKDTKFLDDWRERVGQKRAEGLTRIAGVIGGDMHKCLERYLLGLSVEFPNAVVKNLCNQIIPYIDKRILRVHDTECVLWSDELNLAGSCDAIVDYFFKNIPMYAVLDFKTANRQPKIEWVKDYFLQLTAYSLMINSMYNKNPNRGVLLFTYKQQRSEYREIAMNPVQYITELKKRVELFHNMVDNRS